MATVNQSNLQGEWMVTTVTDKYQIMAKFTDHLIVLDLSTLLNSCCSDCFN